jgi:hypothetical protein
MAKALIVGVSRLKFAQEQRSLFPKQSRKKTKGRKKVQGPAEKEYLCLVNHKGNNRELTERVMNLYEKAGEPYGQPGDLSMLVKFEAILGVCAKVVSLKHQRQIVYNRGKNSENIVYLLYSENPMTGGHYDLIGNIKGFYSTTYYCTACDVKFGTISSHRCADRKNWCFGCYNRCCEKLGEGVQCKFCKERTYSSDCQARHTKLHCNKKWQCSRCYSKLSRPNKLDILSGAQHAMTDAEMELDHTCGYIFCMECGGPRPSDHFCYIKRRDLKPHEDKIMFFDFETDQSSGTHVVNFIYAQYFAPTIKQKKNDKAQTAEDLSDHEKWVGDWKDISFSGSTALNDFLKMLTQQRKLFNGYTVIAHNLRGFDGVFVLRELLNNGVSPTVIVKGLKIMLLSIPGCNLRFIDSFNFLPMGLAKLPAAFGVDCGSKGYFPHFFNSPQNWEYDEHALPERKYFGPDHMSASEKGLFEKWYATEEAKGARYVFKEELAKYCKQDVHILAEVCLAYRKLMCTETGCDPFTYLTCASVCSAVYRAHFMPPNAIARVPPGGYSTARFSDASHEWLEYIRRYEDAPELRHCGNSTQGEKKIGKYFVDGFNEKTRTVYEYYGCFYHGCPKCYPNRKIKNPVSQKSMACLLKETVDRELDLRRMGYNVISKWGCKWAEEKQGSLELGLKVKEMGIESPLDPRDAFFGGRTEAFWLECSDIPMSYEDVTSLYPWVNFTQEYPIGHPEIITRDFKELDEYFGLVKCMLLPPCDLYIPVLPLRHQLKLLFPLCKSCAETRQTARCQHSEHQRMLNGTWFTEEVKLAIEKGYQLKKIHSVWHFKERSKTLFIDYVKTFYKKKLLSSKLSFEDDVQIQKFMEEVKTKEGIDIGTVHEFQENAGLRQLTKLMLNNLWGRFGMENNKSRVEFVSSFEALVAKMDDDTIEIQTIRPVTSTTGQLTYKTKTPELLQIPKDTNIFIAVITTAWARIRLYQELDKLKERAIYCDTDSVVYKQSADPNQNLLTGNFLGEMTDELSEGDYITDFVTGGPKNYAYKTLKGHIVVKIKGFSLNSTNAQVFTFENVKRVILNGVSTGGEEEEGRRVGISEKKKRRLENEQQRELFLFDHILKNSEFSSALSGEHGISVYNPVRIFRTMNWNILQRPEQKLYSFFFDKRIILSNLNTIPFGYVGYFG